MSTVASKHTNWNDYINDPAYTKENEELFVMSLKTYIGRGGTARRAIELIMQNAKSEKPPTSKPYTPRIVSQETLTERRRLVEKIKSKYFTASGISWSDVGWHELPAMAHDGHEAVALLSAGPANVPNDGRTVHDVLGRAKIDKIIGGCRQ